MKTSEVWQRITKEEVHSSMMSVGHTLQRVRSYERILNVGFKKNLLFKAYVNTKPLSQIKCSSKAIKAKRLHFKLISINNSAMFA